MGFREMKEKKIYDDVMLRFDYPTPLRVSFISVPSDLLDATRSSIFFLRPSSYRRSSYTSLIYSYLYVTLAFSWATTKWLRNDVTFLP